MEAFTTSASLHHASDRDTHLILFIEKTLVDINTFNDSNYYHHHAWIRPASRVAPEHYHHHAWIRPASRVAPEHYHHHAWIRPASRVAPEHYHHHAWIRPASRVAPEPFVTQQNAR